MGQPFLAGQPWHTECGRAVEALALGGYLPLRLVISALQTYCLESICPRHSPPAADQSMARFVMMGRSKTSGFSAASSKRWVFVCQNTSISGTYWGGGVKMQLSACHSRLPLCLSVTACERVAEGRWWVTRAAAGGAAGLGGQRWWRSNKGS